MRSLDYIWHQLFKRPYRLYPRIDVGNGRPVVLLHGVGVDATNWQHVADNLDYDHYRIVAFDLLGFGHSPKPDWLDYSIDDHVYAVMSSLKKTGIDGPITLVGHSMGALIATRIARMYPEFVAHLVLYQPPMYSEYPDGEIKQGIRSKFFVSLFNSLVENPLKIEQYRRMLGRMAARFAIFTIDDHGVFPFSQSLRNTILEQTIYEDLSHLNIQTDVIYGRFDFLIPTDGMKRFLKKTNAKIRLHRINETHRVTRRAGKVIAQVIKSQKV